MTHALLKSKHGTTSVVSFSSTNYPDMIRSGNYESLHEGSKEECQEREQEYHEELENALGGLAD